MKGFDPLQMVTSVFLLIYFLALLYFLSHANKAIFLFDFERENRR